MMTRTASKALAFFAATIPVQAGFAQSVLLQIRPQLGDTLRMHLSQTVEMTGTNKSRGRDSTIRLRRTSATFSTDGRSCSRITSRIRTRVSVSSWWTCSGWPAMSARYPYSNRC